MGGGGGVGPGYLNQVAERLRDLGVAVNVRTARNAPAEAILAYAAQVPVQTMIGYGHPAEAIVRIAAQERADVIALAAHGRGGGSGCGGAASPRKWCIRPRLRCW